MPTDPVGAVTPLVLALMAIALFLVLLRMVLGPSLPDRIVALDLLGVLAVAITATYSILAGEPALLDAAIVMALVAFLGTVALARYLMRTGRS